MSPDCGCQLAKSLPLICYCGNLRGACTAAGIAGSAVSLHLRNISPCETSRLRSLSSSADGSSSTRNEVQDCCEDVRQLRDRPDTSFGASIVRNAELASSGRWRARSPVACFSCPTAIIRGRYVLRVGSHDEFTALSASLDDLSNTHPV